ncbi:hypothetical protein LR392_15455 [Arthrobacter sp. AK04]|uniref:hypothetical protein n=1 Tax=Arthrobacter sp. AK04 TaxID=2900048 RepID=UPI001E33A2C1|nr:hypothetical protein [Arthrobacter sp. AK04]MCD5343621.1 hypothetical protein [Arthrobacter sp. AK04]
MRRIASAGVLPGAAVLLAGALLAGCSTPSNSGPAWTAEPGDSGATATATPDGSASAEPSSGATAAASASATAGPAATASAWKTFSDPAKTVVFDLPESWIAQSVPPEDGTLPGALKIEVKKPDGTFVAALRTGLPPSSADCPADARRPYTVISSVPVELSAEGGEGTIPPRVVFRAIQGYRFFGSYGITNIVGGADGQACELRNIVRGPADKGDYSFGDLVSVRAFAPDEKVAPAKAFDTIDQAATYASESADFANVQRMLMSLEIKN